MSNDSKNNETNTNTLEELYCDTMEQYISKRLTKMQLSEMRKAKHITKKQLSGITGLSIQCISDIESEDSGNPTLGSLIKYLDSLGYEICFQKKKI